MKKFLIAIILLSVLPVTTKAEIADIDPLGETMTTCIDLSVNMRYRMRDTNTNEGVSILQDFLNAEGFLNVAPTGYFGTATLKAVKSFQSSIGISPTGFVGTLTRAKIKALTCDSTGGTIGTTGPTATTVPGCTSTIGYSSTTGMKCDSTTTAMSASNTIRINVKEDQSTAAAIGPFIAQIYVDPSATTNSYIIEGNHFSSTSNTVIIAEKSVVVPNSFLSNQYYGRDVVGKIIRFNIADFGITTSGVYPVQVSTPEGTSNKVNMNVTVVTATTDTITTAVPTVEVISTPTLLLQYDSARKESALVANYSVSVTAPVGANFKLYKYGAFDNDTYAFLVKLNDAKGANGADTNGNYRKVSGNATDNGNYWNISAGQTATFILTANLSHPKTLFAGSYNATLSIYKPAGGAGIVVGGNSTTNSVTIIGETSPYISSISNITNTSGVSIGYTIYGVRFHQTTNYVTLNGVTKTFATGGSDQGPVINFKPADFGIVTSGVYSLQISTNEGVSNMVNVNIGAPAAELTVESIGTPTLRLEYNFANKESALVANYTVKITAGIQPLSFPSHSVNCGGGTPVSFSVLSSSGQVAPVTSCATGPATIPSGTSATYQIKLTANPNQIFAGSYTATLEPVISSLDLSTGQWMTTPLPTPVLIGNLKTNTVTVVGERAPYLTSVTQPTSAGQPMDQVQITGVRFAPNATGNTVAFNGMKFTPEISASDVGPILMFAPSKYGVTGSGVYPVQVLTAEGASNVVNVTVTPTTTTQPSITVTSPNGGVVQPSRQLASVFDAFSSPSTNETTSTPAPQWTYEWTNNLEVGSPYVDDIIALQTALTKEGVYAGEITGGFYSQTYFAVKAFQVKYGIESTGFVGPITRAKLNELY